MKGFKNFLMQGELIVIAVGLVVALAFSTLDQVVLRQHHHAVDQLRRRRRLHRTRVSAGP